MFRKYIVFSLLTKYLCCQMKCLRGPDFSRGSYMRDPWFTRYAMQFKYC